MKPNMGEIFAAAFEKGVPGARVVRLTGTDHTKLLANEEDILREMSSFLDSLP